MMANSLISVRIDPETKSQAEKLYSELGMTMSEAIKVFLKRSIVYGGIPFDLRLDKPNAETMQAMNDIDSNRNVSRTFDTPNEMFEDLDRD
jgi:DNA-damage-inducible protein J